MRSTELEETFGFTQGDLAENAGGGIISTAPGPVRKWIKNHRYGTAYYAESGGVKFRLLSPEQLKALSENSVFLVCFVRNPPIHLILSPEVAG